MSYFSSTRVLALFSLFSATANSAPQQVPSVNEEVTVHEGKAMKINVPECPLAASSVKIIPTSDIQNFANWQDVHHHEAYQLIQNVVNIWKKQGITDYMIYGNESPNAKSRFSWEIVPYPKTGGRFWKQFKVLWNITFGGACLPQVERQRIAKDFQSNKEAFAEPLAKNIASIQSVARGNDAFCNPAVITKQRVYEGHEINVLYNYAPITIGEGKLHFLIVPKQHRSTFAELTPAEYSEAMQLSQKLIHFYKEKGYHTVYLFDKSGAEAGQTVPHWHEHVVFTATKTQDAVGKLTVLKNMLFGSSPLAPQELQMRVEALKKDLSAPLAE